MGTSDIPEGLPVPQDWLTEAATRALQNADGYHELPVPGQERLIVQFGGAYVFLLDEDGDEVFRIFRDDLEDPARLFRQVRNYVLGSYARGKEAGRRLKALEIRQALWAASSEDYDV